jgi:PHP family Zn ribbon phosphoesterase
VNRVLVNRCAQCSADLFEPEWSEHFPDHRIRNVWSCEACGYQFEDTVYYSARELADAEHRRKAPDLVPFCEQFDRDHRLNHGTVPALPQHDGSGAPP